MTSRTLADLIASGEGAGAEFKRAMPSDLGREICAFANTSGGVILLGVADDGAIVGVSGHNRLKSEIQSVARSAEPPIRIEVESADQVLVVRIPRQRRRPYSFGGRFFLREGATTQQMSRDEIREFFYAEGLIQFDRTPCRDFSLEEDLDEEVWALFRERAKIPEAMDPEIALRNLALLGEDGRMTQAGAWLLARSIRKFHTSADLSCALFLGTTKTRILDRRDFDGDVYSMMDDAVRWVLSKLNTEYIIKAVKREERPELPEEAIREAVVNAVAHRDYRANANAQVHVFHDRVEVVSPGGLPPGMTEAELGTRSAPRNALLFGLLHRMGAVERVGSGIRRIRELCRAHGVEEPRIETSEHWVTAVFPRPPDKSGRQQTAGADPSPRPAPRVSAREARLLQCLDGERSGAEILKLLGLKDRKHLRTAYLHPALKSGLVEMTDPDRPRSAKQMYRMTASGREALGARGREQDRPDRWPRGASGRPDGAGAPAI